MTVYVVDEHPLMREALTMLIHRIKSGLKIIPVHRLNVVHTTVEKNGDPELICLDLQLSDTLGISGVQVLRAQYPNVPLAVFTGACAREYETRCIDAGANVFIEKSNSMAQITDSLRSLLVSEKPTNLPAGSIKLTKRQKQLILMLDQGFSNREISEKLDICENTVKVHFFRLFRVLGVNSRAQALHFARTNGWLGAAAH
jgi:DNA-binding NarL/FixJ family response regulator